MSGAYLIGHITVKNEEKWAQYRAQVPATITPFAGELLLRGHLREVLSGQHRHQDTVVIRFPDMAALKAWHTSSVYQAIIPIREEAADIDLLAFEE